MKKILSTLTTGAATLALAVGVVSPAFAADITPGETTGTFTVDIPAQGTVATLSGTIELNGVDTPFSGSNEDGLTALVDGINFFWAPDGLLNSGHQWVVATNAPGQTAVTETVPVTFTIAGLTAGTNYTVGDITSFVADFPDGSPGVDYFALGHGNAVNAANTANGTTFTTTAANTGNNNNNNNNNGGSAPISTSEELSAPATGVEASGLVSVVASIVAVVAGAGILVTRKFTK